MHAFVAVLALAGAAVAQVASTGVMSKPPTTGTAVVYTTVTVCPQPTTFVCEGTTYSATTPSQSITMTCQVCKPTPVPSAPTGPNVGPTPTAPATYTGAANQVQVGGAMAAVALGFLAL